MSTKQNDERRLELLVGALDDTFLSASDEEILEDAQSAGLDTAAEAALVKGALLAALQRFQKRNLVAATAGYQKAVDALIHDGLWCAFEGCHMGESAEYIAEKFGVSRAEMDRFSAQSHARAVDHDKAG